MALTLWHLALPILLVGCTSTKAKSQSMFNKYGCSDPDGDITIRYGQDLNITCILNPNELSNGKNSSMLYFMRGTKIIPEEMIKVINEKSIRLYIKKHEKVNSESYSCKLKDPQRSIAPMVSMNVVNVGVPPQNITDFSCIFLNNENLTCSWTPPKNYVTTNYSLSFGLSSRSDRGRPLPCPLGILNDSNNEAKLSCLWNLFTVPQYRPSNEILYFYINISNCFGQVENKFKVNQWRYLRSNPPESLRAVSESWNTIRISWQIPGKMQEFAKGTCFRVFYQTVYNDKIWQTELPNCTEKNRPNKNDTFTLTNLKYAHTLYDIRVSLRASTAVDEQMWSDNVTTTIRTLSKRPDCPPNVTVGSFRNEYIGNNNRNVWVFWHQIKEEQRNGADFSYYVEVADDKSIKPVELTISYAGFVNLLEDRSYTFHIWSKNDVGLSENKSILSIPGKRISSPLNFVKLVNNSEIHTTSWARPATNVEEITNYTIFWCSNKNENTNLCNGNLDWNTVSPDSINFSKSLEANSPDTYQFAISANTASGSSGMTWTRCTVLKNNRLGYIDNVWVSNTGSNFIELSWLIDCAKIGPIKGYVVEYCPVESDTKKSSKCVEPSRNQTFLGDMNTQEVVVKDLKPYTTYLLKICASFPDGTYSLFSKSLRNLTYEAAPTSPKNVRISNLTNTSLAVTWSSPDKTNGIIKYYELYRSNDTGIKENVTIPSNMYSTVLKDLKAYTNYTIFLKACSVACSDKSKSVRVLTEMWSPGKMASPSVIFQNDSMITFGWSKPVEANGRLDYYEILSKPNHDKNSLEGKLFNKTSLSLTVNCKEFMQYPTTYVSVRAVNIIGKQHMPGPWSDDLEAYCLQNNSVIYVVIAIFVFFGLVAFFYGFRWLYFRCQEVQNIDVIVGDVWKKEQNHDDWNRNSDEQRDDANSATDENSILMEEKLPNLQEGLSGDSSGCSSGHESITSSIESSTHLSNADSGTEHARSPSLNKEGERNSLRQRNIPRDPGYPVITGDPGNAGYVTAESMMANGWPAKLPEPIQGFPYCKVSDMDKSQLAYPTANVNEKLPNSLAHTGNLVKTKNAGYVPHSLSPTANPNVEYVLAGNTSQPDFCTFQKDKLKDVAAEARIDLSHSNNGYVTVSDISEGERRDASDISKPYVPLSKYETKKED